MTDNRVKIVVSAGVIVCLLLLGPLLIGADQLKFEVASVKRTEQCGGPRSMDPGYLALRGVPLKWVLVEAFKVKLDEIEGPSWLEKDCFDILAKMPEGATRDQLPAMLQAFLKERFKLAAHKVDRPRSGYALVVDKGGLKVKEDDPKTEFMGSGRAGAVMIGARGHGRLKGVMSMASLAKSLSTKGYGPVQDLTGLTGEYDIDLSWTPDPDLGPKGVGGTDPDATPPSAGSPAASEPGGSLFAALREIGLKLERRKIPVQFVVIDRIERIPTAN